MHRFCHRAFAGGRVANVPAGCYLILDEVYFCSTVLFTLLAELKLSNPDLKMILVGDPEQFVCPCDHWHGSEISEEKLGRSPLIHQLAGGTPAVLT